MEKTICVIVGLIYLAGMIYSRAVFSANYVESKGYFAYFLFGEQSSNVKALLWPLFLWFEL